jgi:ACS family glucarate transporter-like MFS transporter
MTKGWKPYHTIWTMLFLGWFVSYADRSLTGPVITWMINNKVAFLQSAANPYALGGLLGSLFFAGYMLTQFPGGYFGDKYGYRTIIIISIFWAGITTLFAGIMSGLTLFIAIRVITGLGEGVFYSNDRSLIAQVTPPKKLGLGMGLVITGLSLGLAAATLGTPYLINYAQTFWGHEAWRAPFLLMGTITIVTGFLLLKFMKPHTGESASKEPFGRAFLSLLKYSSVFVIIILTVYFLSNFFHLSEVAVGLTFTGLAVGFILFIYKTKASEVRPVLKNGNLVLLYLSGIPIVWHLWLYGYWSTSIVQDINGGKLTTAALVASFNVIAGLIGYPLGGKISDIVASKTNGRRNLLGFVLICLTVCIFVLASYLMLGYKNLIVVSLILFTSGLFFFATQTVTHALTAELAPDENRGAAFGMWNLVSEIGALLSPVISGAIRDYTGSWTNALLLDGILMGISFILVLAIARPVMHFSTEKKMNTEM